MYTGGIFLHQLVFCRFKIIIFVNLVSFIAHLELENLKNMDFGVQKIKLTRWFLRQVSFK